MAEICGSPDTDEWLKLKVGSIVLLPSGNKLLVVDDDGGYEAKSKPVNHYSYDKVLHYTFAVLEDGSTIRLQRNKVAFDIFCETWKVLSY